jgi:hypothetical protein
MIMYRYMNVLEEYVHERNDLYRDDAARLAKLTKARPYWFFALGLGFFGLAVLTNLFK